MALYLDEVWLKDPSPERMKEFVRMLSMAAKQGAGCDRRAAGSPLGRWAVGVE